MKGSREGTEPAEVRDFLAFAHNRGGLWESAVYLAESGVEVGFKRGDCNVIVPR